MFNHSNRLPGGSGGVFQEVLKTCGHGTKDHGFVKGLSVRQMVGFDDREGLFQPTWFCDPVMLCPTFPAQNQPDSYCT